MMTHLHGLGLSKKRANNRAYSAPFSTPCSAVFAPSPNARICNFPTTMRILKIISSVANADSVCA